MGVFEWVSQHWEEVLAAIGLGGGSGLAAKKIVDSKQDSRISDLEKKIKILELEASNLKNAITMNTSFDKELRKQIERDYMNLKNDVQEVKVSLQSLVSHLLKRP